MNVPPSYNRDNHETAVRCVLAKAADKRGHALTMLIIGATGALLSALTASWIFAVLYLAIFAWEYHVWKVNRTIVKHILEGQFNYPSPVVEKIFNDELEAYKNGAPKE